MYAHFCAIWASALQIHADWSFHQKFVKKADASIGQKYFYIIKLYSWIFKIQTYHKAVKRDTQKSCLDFHPMLQLYCLFYTTRRLALNHCARLQTQWSISFCGFPFWAMLFRGTVGKIFSYVPILQHAAYKILQ